MYRRCISLGLLLIVGCTEQTPSPPHDPQEQTTDLGRAFEPATAGAIKGCITWEGDIPAAKENVIRGISSYTPGKREPIHFVMPHYPRVDAGTRGVEGALVFLRGVESARSKPWDHPRVRVTFHDGKLKILQGGTPRSIGIVRRRGVIEAVNRDDDYHNLHIRGVAYFALPLIDKDAVQRRALVKSGVVDLHCGAGYYWLHAHLFVSEHPYVAVTDSNGRFTLDQVPPDRYEVICWMPSWHTTRQERDPETGIITRLVWAEPKKQALSIEVRQRATEEADFRWSQEMFASH